MRVSYAPRTLDLAANVVLERAVQAARARLAGVRDPAEVYDANARTFLVAISAVDLIDGKCP